MAEPAIEVKNLHKEFLLPQHKYSSLKERFAHIGKRNVVKHQKVLNGINFEVQKGDFFGIVGRNGSGKSTLLKILAGVYVPTEGEVKLHGALTPFIELGVGFNPELSGRDNVFLNGALLGFSRIEMAAMYDEIVNFAELGEFMDQKLKNYSSGMQVRLAFSIAVKAKNDILIFDEVLAVGDEAFQRKCLDVFEQYKAAKQTVILVTHEMETVRKFCSKAMLISEGSIIEIGNPRAVADRYSQLNQESIDEDVAGRSTKGQSNFLKARTLGGDGRPKNSFLVGEKARVEAEWKDLDADKIESIGINIFKLSGEHITGVNSRFASMTDTWKEKKRITVEFRLNMTPGKYYVLIELFEEEGKVIDALHYGPQFSVTKTDIAWSGLVELPHSWIA